MNRIGLVVIGRNEGQRLHRCLLSAINHVEHIVYVDSGSIDNSVDLARSLNVDVIKLDPSIPFTAARARNEGFAYLLTVNPQIEYVQFIDGDCEIVSGWLEFAQNKLDTQLDVAVICGRRCEQYPDQSIYNRLCDMEWNWDAHIGEVKSCGGDAMMRVKAFQQVGGFNPALIAGEEPELCVRLRQIGWKVWRLNTEMTLHDAHIMYFKQWWRRTIRAGYAYSQGAWLHGSKPERHWMKESQSILLWGFVIPLLILSFGWFTHGLSLLLLIGYPLLGLKVFIKALSEKNKIQHAALYAFFCVLSKFAQVLGLLDFLKKLTLQSKSTLIEYKNSSI